MDDLKYCLRIVCTKYLYVQYVLWWLLCFIDSEKAKNYNKIMKKTDQKKTKTPNVCQEVKA